MSQHNDAEVKRFFAPTMRRALDLVSDEMGPEAVILSSRKIDGGVEIITSIERDLPTRGIADRRSFGQNFDTDVDTPMDSDLAWRSQAGIQEAAAAHKGHAEMNGPRGASSQGGARNLALEIEQARERMLAAKRQEQEAASTGVRVERHSRSNTLEQHEKPSRKQRLESSRSLQNSNNVEGEEKLENLQSELADMRMLLEQQLWHMSKSEHSFSNVTSSNEQNQSFNSDGFRPQIVSAGQIKMPRHFNLVNQHLSRLGLPESMTNDLLSNVDAKKRPSDAWRACMSQLAKKLPVLKSNPIDRGGIFAFVGQTGVGKTTSIAKLAAQYLLDHGPGRVALVTTDTYRVGAYEQLKSLGKILNVPVKAVDQQNSLLTVVSSLKQFELILIDTAGFRHGDPLLKSQLAQLDTCPSAKRLLVMSCNSQLQTMKASVHAYSSRRKVDACVMSKVDEAASLGEAISVVIEHDLPVAFTTDGQEIPKDITHATGHSLVTRAVSIMKSEQSDSGPAEQFN